MPFRAFSSQRAGRLVGRPHLPSWRCLPLLPSAPAAIRQEALATTTMVFIVSRLSGRLQGFTHAESSFEAQRCLVEAPADALLGFCLSRVFPFCDDRPTFVGPPLLCFCHSPLQSLGRLHRPVFAERYLHLESPVVRVAALQSFFLPQRWRFLSRDRLTLLRFLASSNHTSSGSSQSGRMY